MFAGDALWCWPCEMALAAWAVLASLVALAIVGVIQGVLLASPRTHKKSPELDSDPTKKGGSDQSA